MVNSPPVVLQTQGRAATRAASLSWQTGIYTYRELESLAETCRSRGSTARHRQLFYVFRCHHSGCFPDLHTWPLYRRRLTHPSTPSRTAQALVRAAVFISLAGRQSNSTPLACFLPLVAGSLRRRSCSASPSSRQLHRLSHCVSSSASRHCCCDCCRCALVRAHDTSRRAAAAPRFTPAGLGCCCPEALPDRPANASRTLSQPLTLGSHDFLRVDWLAFAAICRHITGRALRLSRAGVP